MTIMARRAFAQLFIEHQLCPILDEGALFTITHALVTFQLDFVLHGAILKDYLETSAGAKCNTMSGSLVTPLLGKMH